MRVAFVCWRPYQVFNAVRIIHGKTFPSKCVYDLYIQNLPSLLKLKERLLETGIFESIHVIVDRTDGHGLVAQFRRTINLLFPRYSVRKDDVSCEKHNCDNYDNYDIVMGSGWLSYFVNLANVNTKAKVYMFEDGTATYYGDERTNLISKKRVSSFKRMNRIFSKGPFSVNVDRIYVNNKRLVEGLFSYDVYDMPRIDSDMLRTLKTVFGYTENKLYRDKKIIYLSQIGRKTDENMCEILRSRAKDVIVRPHPYYPFSPEGFDLDDSQETWELIVPSLKDVCLVSEFSTSVFIPQLLYGNKPMIVLLYRFCNKKKKGIDKKDRIVQIFRQDNPNIYTPNSIEEYAELIDSIS